MGKNWRHMKTSASRGVKHKMSYFDKKKKLKIPRKDAGKMLSGKKVNKKRY